MTSCSRWRLRSQIIIRSPNAMTRTPSLPAAARKSASCNPLSRRRANTELFAILRSETTRRRMFLPVGARETGELVVVGRVPNVKELADQFSVVVAKPHLRVGLRQTALADEPPNRLG